MRLDSSFVDYLKANYLPRKGDSTVGGNILPSNDVAYNLGAPNNKFDTIYARVLIAENITIPGGATTDTVDGFHASATPEPDTLLALDGSAIFPTSVYPEAVLLDGSRDLTGDLFFTGVPTFAPVGMNPPFHLGANAQGVLVPGLNADLLDGLNTSSSPGATAAILKSTAGALTLIKLDLTPVGASTDYPLEVTSQQPGTNPTYTNSAAYFNASWSQPVTMNGNFVAVQFVTHTYTAPQINFQNSAAKAIGIKVRHETTTEFQNSNSISLLGYQDELYLQAWSTGTIGTYGHFVADAAYKHANSSVTITNVNGFYYVNQVISPTTFNRGVVVENQPINTSYVRALDLYIDSGSGRYNIYASGNADNYINGRVHVGGNTTPQAQLSVSPISSVHALQYPTVAYFYTTDTYSYGAGSQLTALKVSANPQGAFQAVNNIDISYASLAGLNTTLWYGLKIWATLNAGTIGDAWGIKSWVDGSTITNGSVYGVAFEGRYAKYVYGSNGSAVAGTNTTDAWGEYVAATSESAGSHTILGGLHAHVDAVASATTTAMAGRFRLPTVTSGSISNAYGVYIYEAASGAGTISNRYGIYVNSVTGAAGGNNFALYTNGGSVVFNGAQTAASNFLYKSVNVANAFQIDATTGSVGIGLASAAKPLEVFSASSEQLRLSYTAASVYTDFLTASTGHLVVTPTGKTIRAAAVNDVDLGSSIYPWFRLYASQLLVDTLVAQNVISTVGGRIIVAPTTRLTQAIDNAVTTIYVEDNNLANNDVLVLQARGQIEYMQVTSGASGAGPYSYTVTRSVDPGTAYAWLLGDTVVNTGGNVAADGFMDLYSRAGLKSASEIGPTIVGNNRNSTTYNDWSTTWALGNMNGLYGYGANNVYGVAFGKYGTVANSWITIDNTNGLRIFQGTAASNSIIGQWDKDGVITVGKVGANLSNIQITSGALNFRTNTTNNMVLGTDGSILVGQTGASQSNVYVTAGAVNLRNNTTNRVVLSTDGTITIGSTGASQDNIYMTSGAISIRNNTTERIGMTAAGVLTIKDSGGAAVFTFDGSAGAEFTKPLTLAAGGGIYQGSGTFAAPTTGLKIYNSGGAGMIAGYNAGVQQWYGNTDGKLYAGAGAVYLDSTGINLKASSTLPADVGTNIKFRNPSVLSQVCAEVFGKYDGVASNTVSLYLTSAAPDSNAGNGYIYIGARALNSGYNAWVDIEALDGTNNRLWRFKSDGVLMLPGRSTAPAGPDATYTNLWTNYDNDMVFATTDNGEVMSLVNRSRVSFGPGEAALSGGAGLAVYANVGVITFGDGSTHIADFAGSIGEGWEGRTLTVTVWYSQLANAAGNFRIVADYRKIEDGVLMPSGGTLSQPVTAAAHGTASYAKKVSWSLGTISGAAGDAFALRIYRPGADGADTCATTMGLVAVQLSVY